MRLPSAPTSSSKSSSSASSSLVAHCDSSAAVVLGGGVLVGLATRVPRRRSACLVGGRLRTSAAGRGARGPPGPASPPASTARWRSRGATAWCRPASALGLVLRPHALGGRGASAPARWAGRPCAASRAPTSSSIWTNDGSWRGAYCPMISMKRPSRGERPSATTTRYVGCFFLPYPHQADLHGHGAGFLLVSGIRARRSHPAKCERKAYPTCPRAGERWPASDCADGTPGRRPDLTVSSARGARPSPAASARLPLATPTSSSAAPS